MNWLIGIAIIAAVGVLVMVGIAYGSVATKPQTQSSIPTIAPTPKFKVWERYLGEGRSPDTGVHYADQIQIRNTPAATRNYWNIQDYANHAVAHGGNQIIDLTANQSLYIGGTAPAGLGTNRWVSLAEVDGATILLEGGDIVWLERPPRGTGFTIIIETGNNTVVESHNWNSGWFRTEGTDKGLLNAAVNSATGQPNLFPKALWGQTVKVGDILDVTTPIASQPQITLRDPRAFVVGSGGVLNIRANRWVDQTAGQLVRSVEEMRGAKVFIEDRQSGAHTQIFLDRLQTPTVFPQGWYFDFYTSDATRNTQNVYGALGEVILLASDQGLVGDTDIEHPSGPYPVGKWYRLIATSDDAFHISLLNRDAPPTATPQPTSTPQPTATPLPGKSWHQVFITDNRYLASGVTRGEGSCNSSSPNYSPAFYNGTNIRAEQVGVFDLSHPSRWEWLAVEIGDNVQSNDIPADYWIMHFHNPGEALTEGTGYGFLDIKGRGTPVAVNPAQLYKNPQPTNRDHPLPAGDFILNIDVEGSSPIAAQEGYTILSITDPHGGNTNRAVGDFNGPVSNTRMCFNRAWEFR